MKKYDIIVIGAGIYGLYASLNKNFSNKKILIIEKEQNILSRASYINQARLHNGYHYPRSLSTAKASARYFERFYNDYKFAVNKEFNSIYAISAEGSNVSKEEFEQFCDEVKIPYKKIDSNIFFNNALVSGAYETKEYVYDINLIREKYKKEIEEAKNIDIVYGTFIKKAEIKDDEYIVFLNNDETIKAGCIINTTYAGVNQINEIFNIPKYNIKYELCEVEIGKANKHLKNVAITIMDGPFFSVMPFGKTGLHSLTSVCHTPHETCYGTLPEFNCQKQNRNCSKYQLDNCNTCMYKPETKKVEMHEIYEKYIKNEYEFTFEKSLFAIKPILLSSEDDDSRPTVITKHREKPTFVSCLSGKFNTVYLLDEFIEENWG